MTKTILNKAMRRCIITITDNVAPTSMPYNEFVLYRMANYSEEKQVVLLLFKDKVNNGISIPPHLELKCIGMSVTKLRRAVEEIVAENKNVIFHIHEAKSAVLFDIATHGKYRDKVVYTIHSTYKNYPWRNRLLCRMASLRAKRVVCVSQASYRHYPDTMKNRLKGGVCYIQNGVDTDRILSVRQSLSNVAKHPQFTAVYAARYVKLKKHTFLLNVLKEMPSVRLNLIGSGPLENELKRQAIALNIHNRVSFLGALPRDEVYKELMRCHMFLSTSSYEGLPVAVLEAMSCGLPCLVSDIEQHREIREACLSLLVVPMDISEWKKEIVAISAEESLRVIGKLNQESVGRNFSLNKMHAAYDSVYSSCEAQAKAD